MSLAHMAAQGLCLEMWSRDGRWYEVDVEQEDDAIEYLLTNSACIEDMLAGRESRLRRNNGMESRFRFAKIVKPLPLKVFDETRH
jgi:hypothetical protein